ncbi:MAG: shikimate kinase [Pseudomonadota bacterium]
MLDHTENIHMTTTYTQLPKPVVLIGMMGVGKTSIGRRLAKGLGVEFIDSDLEVENASHCSIADIFEIYGEKAFHEVEHRVIKRLLSEQPHVLATGGSAFTLKDTHKLIKEHGISVWLKVDIETLIPRIDRRDHRPQFQNGNTRKTLEAFFEKYVPFYEKADIHVDCSKATPDETTEKIILELNRHVSKQQIKKGQQIHHG